MEQRGMWHMASEMAVFEAPKLVDTASDGKVSSSSSIHCS